MGVQLPCLVCGIPGCCVSVCTITLIDVWHTWMLCTITLMCGIPGCCVDVYNYPDVWRIWMLCRCVYNYPDCCVAYLDTV